MIEFNSAFKNVDCMRYNMHIMLLSASFHPPQRGQKMASNIENHCYAYIEDMVIHSLHIDRFVTPFRFFRWSRQPAVTCLCQPSVPCRKPFPSCRQRSTHFFTAHAIIPQHRLHHPTLTPCAALHLNKQNELAEQTKLTRPQQLSARPQL